MGKKPRTKEARSLEEATTDLAAVASEFCDSSILVCVALPTGPAGMTRHIVFTRGNPYVARELADLHLDGRVAPGATLVGPAGTLSAADAYEDPPDPGAPAYWASPFAEALARAFVRFSGAVSGELSSALFLGSCGAASVPSAAAVVSFSAGNPLASGGALAEWRESQDG